MIPQTEVTQRDAGQVKFRAGNIIGDDRMEVSFDRQLHVSDVASILAEEMMLPVNVPAYALRSERLGKYLADDEPIGAQVEEDEDLTVTPKTHLGGRPARM